MLGIPFRSHVTHSNAFITNSILGYGLDYTKSVVINNNIFIDFVTIPHLRPDEFLAIKGKDLAIKIEFVKYLKEYKKKAKSSYISRNADFCRYSSLQYFHKELGI